jgi:hypothetical protein
MTTRETVQRLARELFRALHVQAGEFTRLDLTDEGVGEIRWTGDVPGMRIVDRCFDIDAHLDLFPPIDEELRNCWTCRNDTENHRCRIIDSAENFSSLPEFEWAARFHGQLMPPRDYAIPCPGWAGKETP